MANIPGFETPNLGLQPTEIGVESTAAAARRSGAFFHQAAQSISDTGQRIGSAARDLGTSLDLVVTHRQINQGALEFSKLIAQSTADWNEASSNADPNDPSVAGKFREEVLEPRLQKFIDSFDTQQGQNWAQNHANQLRQHFVEKTTADMATNAAVAVNTNLEQMRNSLSNAARMDPSSVDFQLKNVESMIDGMVASSPNLKGTVGNKVKAELLQKVQEQIVKAGALGAIEKSADPEKAAAEFARRYPQFVNAQEIGQFSKAATAQMKANIWYTKQNELLAKQLAAENAHKELSQLWTDNVRFDSNGRPAIQPGFLNGIMDIEKRYPGAATERAKSMINWAQAQQRERKENIVTDPAEHARLYDGLFNPDKPTTDVDILDAAARNKLSQHDTSTLLHLSHALQDQMPKDAVFRAKMDAVKEHVGLSIMPDGHNRYASFVESFLPEYLRQKRAGTLPPDALNMNDPKSLIRKWADQFAPDAKERLKWSMYRALGRQYPEDAGIGAAPPANQPAPKVGDTKQFKQGLGRWNGSTWVPAGE